MVGAWWVMMCDDNHHWEVFEDGPGEPSGAITSCPEDGGPAVTAERWDLADRAVIAVAPMAGARENHVSHADEYRLELHSRRDPKSRLISPGDLTWEQVTRYLEQFHGIPWSQVEHRWHRTPRLNR